MQQEDFKISISLKTLNGVILIKITLGIQTLNNMKYLQVTSKRYL